ncbi:MAG: hypothetical protein QOC93_2973 [Actinomycetota bacterium]|nr:hypothetical protein [Actinomycetota bacterium]
MAQFQVGEVPAAGVGGERGDSVPVGVSEPQLRAGVRAFLAHDHPHSGRPRGEIQQPSDLRDPGPVPDLAVAVVGRGPHTLGDLLQQRPEVGGQGEPHRVGQPLPGQPGQEAVSGSDGVGAGQDRPAGPLPGRCRGSCRSAARVTAMWSAAVLEPALPGPQQHLEWFPAAGRAVVGETPQGLEPVAPHRWSISPALPGVALVSAKTAESAESGLRQGSADSAVSAAAGWTL